uniref:Variant surface glycoprotein 1883 n=1 Tax=Trypanosoma brucei TaxID=5691 RepID=M4SXK6_9TRYP|nr:variant surface glycoprotein 1883 [Trypanosoma brucei]
MPKAAGRFLPQLLFAALFTLMEISAQDAELDAAANKVVQPCDEAAYLSKLLRNWKGDIGAKLDAVKLHEEDALTWQLAAAVDTEDEGSRARTALALLSENRARKAREAAEIAKAKLEPAIATLTSRVAAVIAVSKATPGTVKGRQATSAVGNPAELATTSAECPITFTMKSAADTCGLSKIAGTEINSLNLDTKTKQKGQASSGHILRTDSVKGQSIGSRRGRNDRRFDYKRQQALPWQQRQRRHKKGGCRADSNTDLRTR